MATTIKKTIDELKELPDLAPYSKSIIGKALRRLIKEVKSDLVHVKTSYELNELPDNATYGEDYWGDPDEDTLEFYVKGHGTYEVAVENLVVKDGIRYYKIVTEIKACPLCGEHITMKSISGSLISGGYSNRYYKGNPNQSMCFDCSRKIDKEEYEHE